METLFYGNQLDNNITVSTDSCWNLELCYECFWAVVDAAMLTVVYCTSTLLPFVCNHWVTYITTGLSLLYRIIILSDNCQSPIPIDLFIVLTLPLNQQPMQAKE